ncbi:beta-sandwich domain-containing protein [Rhodothermus marinus]|uniref:beta-sandwich domain-containing protein n=1 Tax=Rhodothermus marinus TaxID=29549 RepID=UPI0006D16A64|nr:DUF2012 domain-containing protein [Rhodothermus marinus]
MMQKLLRLSLLGLLWPTLVLAQTGTIRGTVTDATTGDILPGAQIVLKELNTGAATDVDGKYTIPNVPPGTYTLEARFVGYRIVQVSVQVDPGEEVVQDFALEPTMLELEEVVVTGTGGLARRLEVGNTVEQVTAAELERVAIADFGDIIQGKAPGITVMENSGMVGAGATIRLHGNNSLLSNDPIIYIDGVRVGAGMLGRYDAQQSRLRVLRLSDQDLRAYFSWMQGTLVFQETPLKEVQRQLQRWFGVRFVCPSSHEHVRLTASFQLKQPVAEIAEAIGLALQLQPVIQNPVIQNNSR